MKIKLTPRSAKIISLLVLMTALIAAAVSISFYKITADQITGRVIKNKATVTYTTEGQSTEQTAISNETQTTIVVSTPDSLHFTIKLGDRKTRHDHAAITIKLIARSSGTVLAETTAASTTTGKVTITDMGFLTTFSQVTDRDSLRVLIKPAGSTPIDIDGTALSRGNAQVEPLFGDLNNDGTIDLADISRAIRSFNLKQEFPEFLTENTPPSINLTNLSTIIRNYNQLNQ